MALPWPGSCTPRTLRPEAIRVDPAFFGFGLCSSAATLHRATELMMAGTPQEDDVVVDWTMPNAQTALMHGRGRQFTELAREFYRERGSWTVDHAYFSLSEQFQNAGHARRMMRGSLEAYDLLGVTRVNVTTYRTGGYAWARAGFVARPYEGTKELMREGARQLSPSDYLLLEQVLQTSAPDDLMLNIAGIVRPDGSTLGKEFLRNSEWVGFIDLSQPSHRARVAAYVKDLR